MAHNNALVGEARTKAQRILANVRKQLTMAAGDDAVALFRLRRYVYVRLAYDERGHPARRRALKKRK